MTDKLARIEATAKATYYHGEELDLDSADVLALVKIAKAARFAVHSIDPNATLPRKALEDALAVLDTDSR